MSKFLSVLLISFLVFPAYSQQRTTETQTSETEKTLQELREKAAARKRAGQKKPKPQKSQPQATQPQTDSEVTGPRGVDEINNKTSTTTTSPRGVEEYNKKTDPTAESTTQPDTNNTNNDSTVQTFPAEPTPEAPKEEPVANVGHKYPFGAFLNYSLLDLIIPSKYGLSGYFQYAGVQWEAEYLTGTMNVPLVITDIGEITDQRFTLRVRKFTKGGKFNWFWGITYFSIDSKLGADFLNSVIPGSGIPDVDLIHHRALGFDVGLGHRWEITDNFSFGVDWIGWSQPITTLQKDIPFLQATGSAAQAETVQKAINLLSYTPRISVARLSIGYVF